MTPILTKAGNKNILIDLPSNQLTFLDGRFYFSEGDFFPSVTTYLEAYPKGPQYYEWLKKMGDDADEIRDEAGRRGSVVHGLTERFDNGEQVSLLDENGFIAYRVSEWAVFERYVEFRRKHQTFIIHNEINIICPELRAGGTIDRVMNVNGQLLIVDIKTSTAVHPHYWLQLAAYRRMLELQLNQKVEGVAILWLNAKTRTDGKTGQVQGKGWQLITEKDTDKYLDRFYACQKLWLAENEDQKPRQLSYSITHKY